MYVGKVDNLEVDFVAMDESGLRYIQAAATVREIGTLERELKPLRKIADNYPKCIMTLDVDPPADYEGIRRFNALDYLLGKIDF